MKPHQLTAQAAEALAKYDLNENGFTIDELNAAEEKTVATAVLTGTKAQTVSMAIAAAKLELLGVQDRSIISRYGRTSPTVDANFFNGISNQTHRVSVWGLHLPQYPQLETTRMGFNQKDSLDLTSAVVIAGINEENLKHLKIKLALTASDGQKITREISGTELTIKDNVITIPFSIIPRELSPNAQSPSQEDLRTPLFEGFEYSMQITYAGRLLQSTNTHYTPETEFGNTPSQTATMHHFAIIEQRRATLK